MSIWPKLQLDRRECRQLDSKNVMLTAFDRTSFFKCRLLLNRRCTVLPVRLVELCHSMVSKDQSIRHTQRLLCALRLQWIVFECNRTIVCALEQHTRKRNIDSSVCFSLQLVHMSSCNPVADIVADIPENTANWWTLQGWPMQQHGWSGHGMFVDGSHTCGK